MSTEYEKYLGKRIRQLRMDKGYTQEILAAKFQLHGCDMNRSAGAKIEASQRYMKSDELKALKEILNVTYDDILK